MCPSLPDLTCYIGNYTLIFNVLSYAITFGTILGFMVGIVKLVIKKRK